VWARAGQGADPAHEGRHGILIFGSYFLQYADARPAAPPHSTNVAFDEPRAALDL